jgi:hypothetical protein
MLEGGHKPLETGNSKLFFVWGKKKPGRLWPGFFDFSRF